MAFVTLVLVKVNGFEDMTSNTHYVSMLKYILTTSLHSTVAFKGNINCSKIEMIAIGC